MSTFESSRRMTCREQTAYDMGYQAGKYDAVVHGEWVLEHGDYGQMMCSVCKKEPPTEKRPDPYEDYQMTEFYITSDYCPNCGAKMDGKDGERK